MNIIARRNKLCYFVGDLNIDLPKSYIPIVRYHVLVLYVSDHKCAHQGN